MPDSVIVDTGASPWTMLLVALVGGVVASAPSIFAAVRAWASRKKIASELKEQQDKLALALLVRQEKERVEKAEAEEKERVAALERAKISAHLAEVTNQLRVVTPQLEAAMATRVANQAATEAQLAGIASAVGAPVLDPTAAANAAAAIAQAAIQIPQTDPEK